MSVSPARTRRARTSRRGAAFYDLDGTLIDLNLAHTSLFMLSNLAEWTGRVRHLLGFAVRLPLLYLAPYRDPALRNLALFEVFKGISRDRLEVLGEEYCERILADHLYPRALAVVEGNRANGLEPVLITGSPDFVVAPLAARLGIRAFAANRLIYSRGRATGRLHQPMMTGEAKAAWCASYIAANRLDMDTCWGYANAHSDRAFLGAVGHPVAVNPDRRLRALALRRHWPILHFERGEPGRLKLPREAETGGETPPRTSHGAARS